MTISEISITDNSFSAPSSYSLLLQSGTGLHVLRNQFSDITDGAVVLGNGGSLSNVNVDDNTYSLSFAALPGDPIFNAIGDGGSLSNVAFRRNRIQTFVSQRGSTLAT